MARKRRLGGIIRNGFEEAKKPSFRECDLRYSGDNSMIGACHEGVELAIDDAEKRVIRSLPMKTSTLEGKLGCPCPKPVRLGKPPKVRIVREK